MAHILTYISAGLIFFHGLIHILGFVTYWQLAQVQELPYKTTLLQGSLEVGEPGIRIFGALWLVVMQAILTADAGLIAGLSWWRPLMIVAALLSLALTVLDYDVAPAGIVFNLVLLGVLFTGLLLPNHS